MSGTSGITTITLTADPSVDMFNKQSGFTLSNANRSLYMGVAQKQFVPSGDYLILQPASVNFDINGGEDSIRVFSNQDWVLQCSDWIELNETSGHGNTVISYNVGMNMEGVARNGYISGYCTSDSSVTASTSVVQDTIVAENTKIYYLSNTERVVQPSGNWNANQISNVYENGIGVITFDRAITAIPNNAFLNRDALTYIIYPNTVTSIGEGAFSGTSLEKIAISEQVTHISGYAFQKTHLTDVYFYAADCTCNAAVGMSSLWCSVNDMTLHLGNTVEKINDYLFSFFRSSVGYEGRFVGEVVVPNSVPYIGRYAFTNSEISKIVLGENISEIRDNAFNGTTLSEIYIYSQECPTIGENAFLLANFQGTLHYPSGSDYSSMISALPRGWTAIGDL